MIIYRGSKKYVKLVWEPETGLEAHPPARMPDQNLTFRTYDPRTSGIREVSLRDPKLDFWAVLLWAESFVQRRILQGGWPTSSHVDPERDMTNYDEFPWLEPPRKGIVY